MVQDGTVQVETVPVDSKPWYVLGRDASKCDIVTTASESSRMHAALVHHKDDKIYLIDLQSSKGTFLNGKRVTAYKPTLVTKGDSIYCGAPDRTYTLNCETSGVKRRTEDGEATLDKRAKGVVRASHILVKHRGSRRPSSWKENVVTRTEDEALEMIKQFREQIASGQVDFATLAAQESHCSSARRGGDLGEFGPGKMQPAFEQASFALAVGEMSGPVFSDSGVHIILRTA